MDSEKMYPIKGFKNTIFLKALIANSDVKNVHVGEYSYYSDFDDPTNFLTKNILYNLGISGNALYIGKFCAIAHGVKFIMPDANHATTGVTTYPFAVFGDRWAEELPLTEYPFKTFKDTVVGDDVWIGYDVTIMPGVEIGSGSIIGAKSVVSTDIPPYSVAVGNPAGVVKQRYRPIDQEKLMKLSWWDWEQEKISAAIPILVKGDVEALEKFDDEYKCVSSK